MGGWHPPRHLLPRPPLLVRPEVNLFLLLVHVLDSFAFRLAHIRVDVF